jgi:hypothetical protein
MKEEVVRKYVRDLDGLLEELSLVQAIPAVGTDEKAVFFLFGRIFRFLNFDDVTVGHEKAGDLDAWAWNEREQRDTIIEFEATSRNFRDHKHDPNKCNLTVRWEHNWKKMPSQYRCARIKAVLGKRARTGNREFMVNIYLV